MDKDEENVTAETPTLLSGNIYGMTTSQMSLKTRTVLDEQQCLRLKAFAKKARAPQCKKAIKDRRVDTGQRLCKNKTWRTTGMCHLHEKAVHRH